MLAFFALEAADCFFVFLRRAAWLFRGRAPLRALVRVAFRLASRRKRPLIQLRPWRFHPAAVSGEHREPGDLKLIGQLLLHPSPQYADNHHQQLPIPAAQPLEESLTGFAGGREPVKNLPDNLTGVLEPLPQGWAIGGGPKQGRGRQHARFPCAPLTNVHADKQRRREKPSDHLPQNLMIDDDLLRRLPVLMRHPKLLLGACELSEINSP
jgi:hypothetical protein